MTPIERLRLVGLPGELARLDTQSGIVRRNDPGLADVRRVITEIDIAPKQVLIEARIVEASKNFARDLGVKLGLGSKGLASLGGGAQIGFGKSSIGNVDTSGTPAQSGQDLVNAFGTPRIVDEALTLR